MKPQRRKSAMIDVKAQLSIDDARRLEKFCAEHRMTEQCAAIFLTRKGLETFHGESRAKDSGASFLARLGLITSDAGSGRSE